ncbi:MAG: copper-translocating P-type ATPase [Chloroflexi bacterium]|nr:copper-translocating P-type ATPase [Chloroflexota bacterium]
MRNHDDRNHEELNHEQHAHAQDAPQAQEKGHADHVDHEMPAMAGHEHHDMAAAEGYEHHGAHAMHDQGPADGLKPSAHAGHADHTGHEEMFRARFWVSLVLSIPVLIYSPSVQKLFEFSAPPFTGSEWIAPGLSVILFFYGGSPFLRLAVPELRQRKPGMMTLISLAISVAFFYSLAVTFVLEGDTFWWELVLLLDVMLFGHWMEMRSVRQASGALSELAKLMPDTADLIDARGDVQVVPVGKLQMGDLILVRPGANVPADGVVETGESEVNEALITGESLPLKKSVGATVIGGSINGDGSLRVRVKATGDETALAGIMRLVEEAQASKSNTQLLADKAAGWLFYIAVATSLITGVVWTIAIGFQAEVIARAATVLVIACPHALGLAIPLVVAISTAMGAKNGILVRDRLALEEARLIDMVIFDKTGTLTKGEFGVVAIATAEGWEDDQALALIAAVEGDSEHTIARGIRQTAAERGLQLPAVAKFEAIQGRGVKASVDGREVFVGGPRLLDQLQLNLSESMVAFRDEAGSKGQSVVYLVEDGAVAAALALADVVRPESKRAIDKLHEMGVQVAMLTGDSAAVAQAVADELGIDEVFAEVLPEHKDQKVAELQRQGKRVAMVGDGVNDAPALTRADVGIAIGSGTDVAVASADIILVKSNPLDVVKIFELSRASRRKMVQNLIWATGYNIIAIPAAAGLFIPFGVLLSPAIGAAFMSASTVIVAINAQTLRRLKLAA